MAGLRSPDSAAGQRLRAASSGVAAPNEFFRAHAEARADMLRFSSRHGRGSGLVFCLAISGELPENALPSRRAAAGGVCTGRRAPAFARAARSLELECVQGAPVDAGLSHRDVDGLIPMAFDAPLPLCMRGVLAAD
jgi:hypothetical protein